jgi:2-C-methyl-D-erythritol 4-phosphate cytidylyltransferase
MHHYGHRLHLVHGLRGNVKLTVPLDVVFFGHLVESGEYERVLRGEAG